MRFHAAVAAIAATAAMGCADDSAPVAPAFRPSMGVGTSPDIIRANATFPVEIQTINPCNGELVQLTGSVHQNWLVSFDEDGRARFQSHFNYQGIGGMATPSGTRYRAIGVTSAMQTSAPEPPISFRFNDSFHLVARGDEPDFRVHGVFHATIDEDFQQRILVDNFTAECSGANADDRVTQAASGHANLTQGGELRTLSFAAIRHADGRVSGQWELNNRANDTRLHGSVTCLTVIDNRAWIGGILDQSSNPTTIEGRGVSWRVLDNGEGADAPPDQLSLTFTNLNPEIPEIRCRNAPPYPLLPVEAGNIHVRD